MITQTDDNLLTSEQVPDLIAQCYPEGVPEGFPVEWFAPSSGEFRAKLDSLQDAMLTMPQVDVRIEHEFAEGVYIRKMHAAKGTVVIGKLHLTSHLNICLQGDLTFLTEGGAVRIQAPQMFVAPAGTKKLAYMNEDTVWVNVHPALSSDPEEIIAGITVDTFREFDALMNRASFLNAIEAHGYDEAMVAQISHDPTTFDAAPIPGVEVRDSRVAGQGLFACAAFAAGDRVAPGVSAGKRTLAGRYINHGTSPNVVYDAQSSAFVALRDIEPGEELLSDYSATLAVIEGA